MGLEQPLNSFIVFRGGIISDEDFSPEGMKYTYGFGFRLKLYEISFASEQSKISGHDFTRFMFTLNAIIL